MDFLIVLVIFWAPYLVAWLLRAEHASAPIPARPQRVWAAPPSKEQTDTASQDGPGWSALDDRQLTRLLINSAPPTSTNRTLA